MTQTLECRLGAEFPVCRSLEVTPGELSAIPRRLGKPSESSAVPISERGRGVRLAPLPARRAYGLCEVFIEVQAGYEGDGFASQTRHSTVTHDGPI